MTTAATDWPLVETSKTAWRDWARHANEGESDVDILALADSPAAKFIEAFSPTAKSVLEFARSHRELIRKAIPIILAAKKEGPAVIADIQRDAPELIAAIKNAISTEASTRAPARAALTTPISMNNMLLSVAGLPRLTIEEESAFLDRYKPLTQDSQSGSG